jgi:hypothetical protein
MSRVEVEPVAVMSEAKLDKSPRALSLAETFLLAPGVVFSPRRVGKLWQRIALWRAGIVAAVNLATLPLWLILLVSAWQLWREGMLRARGGDAWARNASGVIRIVVRDTLHDARLAVPRGIYNNFLAAGLLIFMLVLLVALVFFVILPFAARPGSNSACTRHVTRAALLSSGLVHFWMAALTLDFALMIWLGAPGGIVEWMPPVFATVCVLLLGTMWVLIRAVRVEYRRDFDFPKSKTPQCDVCGYDLHMTDPSGRCPECGKPVAESLGSEFRKPLPWENHPHSGQWGIIARQLRTIIFRPRDLFFRMPTQTGQRAAQRWLLLTMILLGAVAFWTFPAMALQLRYGYVGPAAPKILVELHDVITLSPSLVLSFLIGGVVMAMFWAIFGMLMVGIETAGVAAVARFRKQTVPLASAAKVTCYASPLMVPWAFLGGLQIVLLILAYQRGWMTLHPRAEEIALVASTAIAHIGGLLWFEFTVYRGLRAIQYANH